MKPINFLKYIECLFFPSRCKVCNKVVYIGKEICNGCNSQLRPIPENISLMLVSNPNVNVKLGFKPRYDGVISPYYHEDGSKTMVYNLKFKGRKELVSLIGKDMSEAYNEYLKSKDIDCVCYVPCKFISTLKRGYNHVWLLAKYFSKASNLQLISALKLVRNKLPQHTLSRAERIENIKGAFGFIDKYEVKGKTVLLIDDIMTTGATFNECAKVLKRAGAKRVYGLMATINI